MFAYCENNPIALIDPDGEISIWPLLFSDNNYGFIHFAVQVHIALKYGLEYSLEMECKVEKGGQDVGRADIVSTSTGSVWEVKSFNKFDEAEAQLARYLGGTAIRTNTHISSLGAAGAFNGTFTIGCGSYYYDVVYFTPWAGTVLYAVSQGRKQSSPAELYDFAYEGVRTPIPNKQKYPELAYGTVPAVARDQALACLLIVAIGGGAGMFGGCAGFDPKEICDRRIQILN